MNKYILKLHYLFSFIFASITGILAILSMFIHCQTNIYTYDLPKHLEYHTALVYIGLAAFGIAAIAILCRLLEYIFKITGKGTQISHKIVLFCGAVILMAGIFWISFNDGVPVSDQIHVHEEAQRIAGFLDSPFDTGYFSYYQRNRGVTLLAALAFKIFGNHLYSFQIFNLAALLITYCSICKASELIYKNPLITSITAFLLMLFYPLFIYTSYLYGTLLSAGFASLGLYAATALCVKGKMKYGLLMIFAFPFGILMHQSAAISLVASVIYLFIHSKNKTLLRNVIISIATIVMVFLSVKAVDTAYVHITGADPSFPAVPATCTMYMGLTATEGYAGPGSHDGSESDIFNENNRDEHAANKDAVSRIFIVVREYLTGKRSLNFFLEKTEYQWLDPTFNARRVIRLNDLNEGTPPNSDSFIAFYNSSFRTIIFKLSIGFMLLIYACSFLTGTVTIRNIMEHPLAILIQLYFIGGFAFQLIWESFSRYCFCYFLWLIPEASFGLYYLYSSILKMLAKQNFSHLRQLHRKNK